MFKKTVLENKLRILTAPMSGTNTVTVLVLCGTGSDYESREIGGISHFLEHMFFKGTEKRPEARIVSEELDGMGAVYNAFTSHEITGYFVKSGKAYFEKSLDVLADIYKHSLLDAEEIDRERQVIVEELHRDKDTPTMYIWWLWEKLLYGDQPAGWDVIGTEETIRSLPREEFVNYFQHQYTASNTAIVIAGNVDESDAIRRVTELFSDIRDEAPIRTKPELMEEQSAPAMEVSYKETDQTHLVVGFRGYDANHPKRYVAEVLAAILGSGMSSRMFSRIRERLGLAYTVMTDHESYSNRGFLVTYAGVDHRNVEQTLSEVLKVYKKVCEEGVSKKELTRVKDYVRGTMLISLEASNAVANFVGGEEMLTGKPLTTDEVFAKLDTVTVDDVRTVAQEIMRPERLNVAMIGPFKDASAFQGIIDEF